MEIVSTKPNIWRISTPRPYNEIETDSLLYNIINCERDMGYVYGTDDVSELSGLCLRAYTVWVQRLTGNDSLQVKALSPFQTFRNSSPFSPWAYEYDNDKEDENGNFLSGRELIRANKYIDKVPFDVITGCELCNLEDLLGPNVSLVKVEAFYGIFTSLCVKLYTIIPTADENQWKYRELIFMFRLKVHTDVKIWNNNLKQALNANPNYLVGSDNFIDLYDLLKDASWVLWEISILNETMIDNSEKELLNDFLTGKMR